MNMRHLRWLPITAVIIGIFYVATGHGGFAAFLKDYQTLVAGLLAIGAAYVAFEAATLQVHQREKELDETAAKERERRSKALKAFLIVLREDVDVLLKDVTDQMNCVGLFRLEDGMSTDRIERFFKGITPRVGRSLVLKWENSELVERPEILQRIERLNNSLDHLDDALSWIKGEIIEINKELISGGSPDIEDILKFYDRTAKYCLGVILDLQNSLLTFSTEMSELNASPVNLIASEAR